MVTSGSSNDVKIVLEDGEIFANKDVLSARSDYFATMFSSKNEFKFIEGENNTVDMGHCSKVIMDKIIKFMFSGGMCLHDLSLLVLVKMMNMTSMMMLDDLHNEIRDYVLEIIPGTRENYAILPELVNSLKLAENFKFEELKKSLVLELFLSLEDLTDIPDVVQNSDAFMMLPSNLLKEILLKNRESTLLKYYVEDEDEDYVEPNETDEDTDDDDYMEYDTDTDDSEDTCVFTSDVEFQDDDDDEEEIDEEVESDDETDCIRIADDVRFDAFEFWLTRNECSDEVKKEIMDSFDLVGGSFTAEKLLTDVRRSGLYSIEEIDRSVLEIIRCSQNAVSTMEDHFSGVIKDCECDYV